MCSAFPGHDSEGIVVLCRNLLQYGYESILFASDVIWLAGSLDILPSQCKVFNFGLKTQRMSLSLENDA